MKKFSKSVKEYLYFKNTIIHTSVVLYFDYSENNYYVSVFGYTYSQFKDMEVVC